MAFDFSTLITDRSPEDLQALRDLLATPMADWTAEQLAQFNQAASKGAYNYTDLNRVIAAMDDINERLTAAGYVTGYQRVQVPHQGGKDLPDGYTRLTWIESSGAQYIDTGIKPNQDTQVTAKLMLLGSTTAYLFGARGDSEEGYNNRYGILYTSDHLFRSDYNTGNGPSFSPDLKLNVAYTIDKDKNVCSMGGFTVTSPEGVFQSPYNMFIGCVNEGGSPAYYARIRIYAFSVAENDELVREYVPCISPSGEIGLYDLQAGEFFDNAGSGKFMAGSPLNSLPNGYTQIEYIRKNGNAYINSEFIPNGDSSLLMEAVVYADSDWAAMFGTRSSGSATAPSNSTLFISPQGIPRSDYFGSSITFPASIQYEQKTIVDLDKNKISVGLQTETHPDSGDAAAYPWFLLDVNTAGSPRQSGSFDLYFCIIFDGDSVSRYLVPCRDPDEAIGMFDIINQRFYQSAGTDPFLAGPDFVPDDPDPQPGLDPYLWYEDDVPTAGLLGSYLANVTALRNVIDLPEDTPEVPADMVGMTQTEANNIEKILEIINEYLVSLQKIFLRCGHAICGNNFYFAN